MLVFFLDIAGRMTTHCGPYLAHELEVMYHWSRTLCCYNWSYSLYWNCHFYT